MFRVTKISLASKTVSISVGLGHFNVKFTTVKSICCSLVKENYRNTNKRKRLQGPQQERTTPSYSI